MAGVSRPFGVNAVRLLPISLLLAGIISPACAESASPSQEQLRKAIDDLASPRFAVREIASRTLWEAGPVAEPLLRQAAKSGDEETSSRAVAILEKFDWGLFADTPSVVKKLIEDFRGGDQLQRHLTLSKLVNLHPPPLGDLRRLTSKVTKPDDRGEMFEQLAFYARTAVPKLIVANELDKAGDLLEICLGDAGAMSMGDFAALAHFRNQTDAKIKRLEAGLAELKGPDRIRAQITLAFLCRTKNDWKQAAKYADAISDEKNTALKRNVAWEASDWKTLTTGPVVLVDDEWDERAVYAAFYRKAGKDSESAALIAGIWKNLNNIDDHDQFARRLAVKLLLNGEAAEVIQSLKSRSTAANPMVFDLLCSQLKFREAFDFADEMRKDQRTDRNAMVRRIQLNLRQVIAFVQLGMIDSAKRLCREQFEAVGSNSELDGYLPGFVVDLRRANLRWLVMECVDQLVPQLEKDPDRHEMLVSMINTVFDREHGVPSRWWQALRRSEGMRDSLGQIRRMEKLRLGQGAAADIALLEKELNRKTDSGSPKAEHPLAPVMCQYALANLYRRHGEAKKADEAFRKAVGVDEPKLFPSKADEGVPSDGKEPLTDLSHMFHPILFNYAEFLFAEGRHREAAGMYERAWKLQPDHVLNLFLQGQCLVKGGDEKRGRFLIEVSHWVLLSDEEGRARFIEELSARGFHQDVGREMQVILDVGWFHTDEVGDIYLRKARLLARQKDFEGASRLAEKAIIGRLRTVSSFRENKDHLILPELARSYRLRAMIASGRFDDAVKEAHHSLDLLPGNVELSVGFLPELEQAGRKKEADALYVRIRDAHTGALKDYPSSADLRNRLARGMLNCNRELEEAKKQAEKAVSLQSAAKHLDTLAEIHFRLRERPKAIELAKKCAELEPKNPYFRKQLERFEMKGFDSKPPDEETGEE